VASNRRVQFYKTWQADGENVEPVLMAPVTDGFVHSNLDDAAPDRGHPDAPHDVYVAISPPNAPSPGQTSPADRSAVMPIQDDADGLETSFAITVPGVIFDQPPSINTALNTGVSTVPEPAVVPDLIDMSDVGLTVLPALFQTPQTSPSRGFGEGVTTSTTPKNSIQRKDSPSASVFGSGKSSRNLAVGGSSPAKSPAVTPRGNASPSNSVFGTFSTAGQAQLLPVTIADAQSTPASELDGLFGTAVVAAQPPQATAQTDASEATTIEPKPVAPADLMP
jgi:hypothetical protein